MWETEIKIFKFYSNKVCYDDLFCFKFDSYTFCRLLGIGKIIEYKVLSAHLNSLCYCLCLNCGFYNTAIDGTHKDQGNLS